VKDRRACIVPRRQGQALRHNDDGTWSHKPGGDRVTNSDATGKTITNPENAHRGKYDRIIGYYEVGR
jgi:hypothetical protein